jgi:hypothetical protein
MSDEQPIIEPAASQAVVAVAADEEDEQVCRYCFEGPEEGYVTSIHILILYYIYTDI